LTFVGTGTGFEGVESVSDPEPVGTPRRPGRSCVIPPDPVEEAGIE